MLFTKETLFNVTAAEPWRAKLLSPAVFSQNVVLTSVNVSLSNMAPPEFAEISRGENRMGERGGMCGMRYMFGFHIRG